MSRRKRMLEDLEQDIREHLEAVPRDNIEVMIPALPYSLKDIEEGMSRPLHRTK